MATNVTRQDLRLVRVGLMDVVNEGAEKTEQYHKNIVGKRVTSKQGWEEILTRTGIGLFPTRKEGANIQYAKDEIRHDKRFYPKIRSLGMRWTKEMKHLDLYDFLGVAGKQLSVALTETKNYDAAMLLVRAFSDLLTPDGLAMAGSHVMKNGGVLTNLSHSPLTSISLLYGLSKLQGQRGEMGIPIRYKGGFKLIVGPDNSPYANAIVSSTLMAGTQNNDRNVIRDYNIDVYTEAYINEEHTEIPEMWALLPKDADVNPFLEIDTFPTETESDYDPQTRSVSMLVNTGYVMDTISPQGTWFSDAA